MNKLDILNEQELTHLVQAYKIQMDLGIYNQHMDYLFEEIRKSKSEKSFLKVLDLFNL